MSCYPNGRQLCCILQCCLAQCEQEASYLLLYLVLTARTDATVLFSVEAHSSTGISSINTTCGLKNTQSSWLSLLCHPQHTSSAHTTPRCCLSVFSKQHRQINKPLAIGEKLFRCLDLLYKVQRFLRGEVLIEDNWLEKGKKSTRVYSFTPVKDLTVGFVFRANHTNASMHNLL